MVQQVQLILRKREHFRQLDTVMFCDGHFGCIVRMLEYFFRPSIDYPRQVVVQIVF